MEFAVRGETMISNTLVHKYNEEDALIVFSSYAKEKDDARDMNALAWYTKHLISSFPKERKVIFLAEKTPASSAEPFEDEKRFLVIPTWQKNSLSSIADVVRALALFSKPKRILFQFEFNIFGTALGPLIMLFLTMFMTIRRKQVFFQIHQIVLDIADMKNQTNVKNPFFIRFFNMGLGIFYRLIFLFSEKVIVTEEALAAKLRSLGLSSKLFILPHHVLDEKVIPAKKPNKKATTLLFFGYLSWYKGIDWLVKAFKEVHTQHPDLRLIVAGGKSPTMKNKSHYNKYYSRLVRAMKKTPGVTRTGFIPDDQVKKMFAKADVLVMPYRMFISSSGPLSWALSQHKPVILSSALKEYMKSEDFADSMKQAKLDENELFFDLNSASLNGAITALKTEKLVKFATVLAKKRSQKNVAAALHEVLYSPKEISYTKVMRTASKSLPHFPLVYAQ